MSTEEADRIAKGAERARRRSRVPLKLVLPTVAALGAGAAVAVGSIPSSTGTITGCYSTVPQFGNTVGSTVPYGSLRLIDPTNTGDVDPSENRCANFEKTVTWNQQGPPGPQGLQGQRGVQGPQGAPGPAGTSGSTALIGETAFEVAAGGATRLFLKIGPSTSKGETGGTQLNSFAFGAETPVQTSNGSGAGAGRVTLQAFQLTKKIDKLSPVLFRDEVSGKTVKTLEVDVFHAGKGGKLSRAGEVATYKLSNVLLKSIVHKGDTETIGGVFLKIQTTIGSGQNKVQTGFNPSKIGGWDVVKNQPSNIIPPG
ncbi:MAG: type VI secretion system tube protein Hcp [Actinomycetota bacterium]|nr:type VI secretion system tube protein Hcp [Actinomycetota bacterium]